MISDTDPQGTAADWFNQRKRSGIDTPLYAPLSLFELAEKREALEAAGAKYFFIDTAPSVGAVNAQLLKAADCILIPLNPTPADLRALVKAMPVLQEAKKPFHFVLTRVRANLRNNNSAAMALEALGLVLPVRMHERVIYAETFAHGKTALEIEANSPAGQEIASLWQAVKDAIGSETGIQESKKARIRP